MALLGRHRSTWLPSARVTRHLLLMTATPHAGKQEDFQLFLALLDGDRFEGRYRDGVHSVDPGDLMRRMVKEELLTMDGRPLFPERRAYTVPYELSAGEQGLYEAVTQYVREEMNRAERLKDAGQGRRGNTVGFALTVLQRRLASSPEAILKSLERRRARLERRRREMAAAGGAGPPRAPRAAASRPASRPRGQPSASWRAAAEAGRHRGEHALGGDGVAARRHGRVRDGSGRGRIPDQPR